MIEIDIPGRPPLRFTHLVLDLNGTVAGDGQLLEGVAKRITTLANQVQVHILTADTRGNAHAQLAGLPCQLAILPPGDQDVGKRDYVVKLGPAQTACIGNGLNDRLMLQKSALGIAVLGPEGMAVATITAADVLASDITRALDLLIHPLRLIATLRV